MTLKELINDLNKLASENPEYLDLPVVAHIDLIQAEVRGGLYSPGAFDGEWYDCSAIRTTGNHIRLLTSLSD